MDIYYTGKMKEFRRQVPWKNNDTPGFVYSYGNYEKMVITGNTFDYQVILGTTILKAGYSFTSFSAKVIEYETALMKDY